MVTGYCALLCIFLVVPKISVARDKIVIVWSLTPVQLFCSSMDCSPQGSAVHGISQAKILGELPFPSPEDLPDPRINLRLQADSLPLSHLGSLKLTCSVAQLCPTLCDPMESTTPGFTSSLFPRVCSNSCTLS